MKKPLLVLFLVSLLSACQVGSETALRQDLEQKFPTDNSTLEMAPRGWYQGKFDDPLMTWDEANRVLKDLKIDGKKGWRLPTGLELLSLCDAEDAMNCTSSDYSPPDTNLMMRDPALPRAMKEAGVEAGKKKHWWWLNSSIPDSKYAVVMAPSFQRTFAVVNAKFRVRPVRGELSKEEIDSSMFGDDVEEIGYRSCYSSSSEKKIVALMNLCSSWLFCQDWHVRSCVLDISNVMNHDNRSLVVIANDESIDTYEYLPNGKWIRIARQIFDWLIDPERTDAWLAEIGLTDFTGDGDADLAIRVGPPVISGDSMDLAVFQWNSDKGGWAQEKFPDANVGDRSGSLVPNPKMLRWGHVYGPDVYENYGYFDTGNFSDEVSLHYRWVNGKFRYMGLVEDVASQQCLLCPPVASAFVYTTVE